MLFHGMVFVFVTNSRVVLKPVKLAKRLNTLYSLLYSYMFRPLLSKPMMPYRAHCISNPKETHSLNHILYTLVCTA